MRESGTVKFLLNDQEVRLDFHKPVKYTPTTTLLNYLRDHPHLRGTKEGCAEGDCGACTVVIVSLTAQDQLHFQACDSCLIFLPMLHGKAIITVEHIGTLEEPHPVQTAMVDSDGSQCGYCTPGFIMSLYALHQNHQSPSREIIDDALTGNLCRCTGYRSILEAAENSRECYPAVSEAQQEFILKKLKAFDTYALAIVGNSQKYFKPLDLEEALKLRSMYPEATAINGATDIALKVTKEDQVLPEVIDLSSVVEMVQLNGTEAEVSLGAGLSLEKVKMESEQSLPALYESLKVFGSVQIRNLATLGGNVASASPIGDTPPVLMAYQAQVELAGAQGLRKLPITEFITGYRSTDLKRDELILRIIVPRPDSDTQVKWYKISKRRDLDISTVSAGFRLKLNRQSEVEELELFYGGMAAKTQQALKTQQFLLGKPWKRDIVEKAMSIIDEDFTPISDARAQASGRKIMARNLLLKFWTDTHD